MAAPVSPPPGGFLRPRAYQPATGGTIFGVIGLVIIGLGAVGWLVLSLSFFVMTPGGRLIAMVLAPLSVPLVLAPFIWADHLDRTHVRLLLAAFAWGALGAYGLSNMLNLVGFGTIGCQATINIGAPVVEEITKAAVLVWLVAYRRTSFISVRHGLVFAGFVAAGFAFSENIDYYTLPFLGSSEDPCALGETGVPPTFSEGALTTAVVFVLRGLVMPFMHPMFTICTGIGLALAVVGRRRWVRVASPVLGVLGAIGLHAAWNTSMMVAGEGWIVVNIVLIWALFGGLVWFIRRLLRHDRQLIADYVPRFVAQTWISPHEVDAFTTAKGRRLAARAVAFRYGPFWGKVLRERQSAAVKLALLHGSGANLDHPALAEYQRSLVAFLWGADDRSRPTSGLSNDSDRI